MDEKMTLEQVRDWHLKQVEDAMSLGWEADPDGSMHQTMSDTIDAHLATPAQTVDVGAARCAITTLRGATSAGMSADLCDELADKLAQAIGDKP